MTHGVYVEVFRVAFVHGNVKSVAVFVFLNHKKKKNEKYIVIALSLVLTVLINWCRQSLWNSACCRNS